MLQTEALCPRSYAQPEFANFGGLQATHTLHVIARLSLGELGTRSTTVLRRYQHPANPGTIPSVTATAQQPLTKLGDDAVLRAWDDTREAAARLLFEVLAGFVADHAGVAVIILAIHADNVPGHVPFEVATGGMESHLHHTGDPVRLLRRGKAGAPIAHPPGQLTPVLVTHLETRPYFFRHAAGIAEHRQRSPIVPMSTPYQPLLLAFATLCGTVATSPRS